MTDHKAPTDGPSKRRMSGGRKLYYTVGLPLFHGILRLLWRSYRVRFLDDQAQILERPPAEYCAPCYWHQDHILCSYLVRRWLQRGFKAGFLISDSVDGEVPARLARSWGAKVVRGSANRTGAAAMRALRGFAESGTAMVTTADGPLGPCYVFKPGVAVTARLVNAPMLPIAAAAERAWVLRRWDRFYIPKPFSRVVVAIGPPVAAPETLKPAAVEAARSAAEHALVALKNRCEDFIKQ